MKYILVLLISFAFGQFEQITTDEIDASIIKWDDEKKMFYTKAKPLLDFTLQTPTTQCFQILLQFQDGWLENMVDIRDSIICPNMIDVRIEYEGIIKDYTMEEFLERLGI